MKHFFTNGLLNIKEDKNSNSSEKTFEKAIKTNLLENENIVAEEQVEEPQEIVEEPVVEEEPVDDGYVEEEIQDDLSYMEQLPPNSKENSTEHEKMKSLFICSENLYDYSKLVEQNIKNIDKSTIDRVTVVKLAQLEDKMNLYINKIKDFVAEVFIRETYEKNLYLFYTLRNEFITIIKIIRKLLKLETMEHDDISKDSQEGLIEIK